MNMLNNKSRTSLVKPEYLKKAKQANPRLYDIGCYNDNLALMLSPESDEVIRLEKESRSKLSDLVRTFDYATLNSLYDLFVPQRKKSSEQRFFSERSRISHINVQKEKRKESFQKQTTFLETRMDESISMNKNCQSSLEIVNIQRNINTIITEMKNKLSTHQDTISILKQQKDAQIKLYKSREDKEIEKVIDLENKVKRANPRLYDIGCYNDNLALMLALKSDEVIRLEIESRSKLSDLINPFDYTKLNSLYDLFVPQREKSSEQRFFLERSRISHINVQNAKKKESFQKQTTFLEKRMDESIPVNKNCQSSLETVNIKININTIITPVELCKQKITNRTYFGHIDPFIQNTIEQNFCPVIYKINVGLHLFLERLNEEVVVDLRYFNSLELEVDSLTSQLETQKTQFANEIDRLSREYYYADHMNVILGVYTELDEVTNMQCDYLELLQKCECLETKLSKSKMMSKSFESVQKHAINLELELQQCKEKIKNDMSFKVNKSKDFFKEHEQYFEIQDLKAQLQDKGIVTPPNWPAAEYWVRGVLLHGSTTQDIY
nr:hypothetical protein [Tanacetum cinerariifolium]